MDSLIHPPTDPVIVGHNLLASNVYPCFTCHTLNIDAVQPWVGNIGPSLNGIGDRAVGSRAQTTGLSGPDYVYQSIHDPTTYLVPGYGPLMPNLGLDDCKIRAIVAYLGTQTESGTPAYTIDTQAYAKDCGGAAAAEATAEATLSAESTVEATSEATSEATEAVATWTPAPTTEATAEATAGS
jgi:cytochrome c2